MLQAKNLILYFLLLVLKILLDFDLDIGQKQGRFFQTCLKKNLEFVTYKKNNYITFNLYFVLLPAKLDLISEKQILKKKALRTCSFKHIKRVLILLIKVVVFYI